MTDKNALETLGIDKGYVTEQIISTVSIDIADRVYRDIKNDVIEQANKIIGKHINEIVEGVLDGIYQPVTTWGEAKGEPTTIRDEFEKAILAWWNQPVDEKGEPTTGYSSRPRSQYIAKKSISKIVDQELRAGLDKMIKDTKSQVKEGLKAVVGEKIDKVWR